MIYPSINGSIINPPAKLFKRYLADIKVELKDTYIIYENQYYKNYFNFRYVESEKTKKEEQILKGMTGFESNLKIKLYGSFRPNEESPSEPMYNDIVQIENQFWIIDDIRRERVKSLNNFAVVYLSLRELNFEKIGDK